MRKLGIILSILSIFLFTNSCVTQKKKGEVGTIGKFYHNTTAKYNGYFNADVLLTESILFLESDHRDNYNQIIPVYKVIAHDNPSVKASDLDKAIEKVSIVRTLHDPAQWVDDCYVLMGKAQFVKQDFESAQNTLEYFVDEFSPLNLRKQNLNTSAKKAQKKKKPSRKKRSTKKRKKSNDRTTPKETSEKKASTLVAENPNENTFGHKSVYEEGMLWLAKTYVAREKYALAEYQLSKLEKDPLTPKQVSAEIPVVRAFSNIRQKKYAMAAQDLEKAIQGTKNKQIRARYTFIQAQLNQHLGNAKEAYAGFEKVLKMRPGYEMEFNARLNLAKSGYRAGKETADQAIKKLEKMAKEKKNEEFLDQIYYTLADINLNNSKEEDGIADLKKSLKHNVSNDAQRVESYYRLATLFYDREDYVSSKFYYDSTTVTMSDKDERFREVNSYSTNLKEIAENLILLKETDSLLAISAMSREDQRLLAAKIKKEELEQQKESEKAARAEASRLGARQGAAGLQQAGAKPSNFFAYDPQKLRKGESDFVRRYGSRALEDNWRRSNKSSSVLEEIEDNRIEIVDITEEEVRKILKNVPSNPTQIEAAHTKIKMALLDLGVLFRDRIENYTKSVHYLDMLQDRYPGSIHEANALYYLYLSHNDLENPDKAQKYFDELVSKYPETNYAQSLTNPEYQKEFKREEARLISYYDETYRIFQSGDYQLANLRISEAGNLFGVNPMTPKFDLLGAMCKGNLEGKEAYEIALKNVVAKHEGTPEQLRAKEILRFLKGDQAAFDPALFEEAKEDFETQDDKLHYIAVILYSGKDQDLTDTKISIANYNREYHKLDKLNISNIFLNRSEETQLILIRKFDNREKAMKYYEEIQKNKKDFITPDVHYTVFAVTQKNYREIIKQRSVAKYGSFFTKVYLGK